MFLVNRDAIAFQSGSACGNVSTPADVHPPHSRSWTTFCCTTTWRRPTGRWSSWRTGAFQRTRCCPAATPPWGPPSTSRPRCAAAATTQHPLLHSPRLSRLDSIRFDFHFDFLCTIADSKRLKKRECCADHLRPLVVTLYRYCGRAHTMARRPTCGARVWCCMCCWPAPSPS